MTSHRSWPQTWALFGAALLAVHEGRFLLGYGGHAQEALARQGHAYLSLAAPLAAVWVAAVLTWLLVRALGGRRRSPSRSRAWSTTRVAAVCGMAVLTLHVGQEALEGLLSPGHPGGLVGVFGAGGWTAVPLSAVAGGILALALRIARDPPMLGAVLDVGLPSRPALTAHVGASPPAARQRSPLARIGAQRAPPATV